MAQKEKQTRRPLTEWQQSGKRPLLPFEEILLKQRLQELGLRQDQLGKLLGEAMDQSSETWHDNHAAEIIADDSRGLTGEAKKIFRTLSLAAVVEYGSVSSATPGGATLGHVVQINFDPKDQVPMLLTGAVTELPPEATAFNPDMEALTIDSPLGAAVLDKLPGSEVNYPVGGRQVTVVVGKIAVFEGFDL